MKHKRNGALPSNDAFFLKTVPYALLLAGAAFMALLVVATQTGSLLFGCCALLVLTSALFMAWMFGTRLASTPRPVAMPVGATVVAQVESVEVGPSSVIP